MDQFDRELKRRAQEEPFPLPDSFVRRGGGLPAGGPAQRVRLRG